MLGEDSRDLEEAGCSLLPMAGILLLWPVGAGSPREGDTGSLDLPGAGSGWLPRCEEEPSGGWEGGMTRCGVYGIVR